MADNNSTGKIISKETADQDFGRPTFSVLMSSEQLQGLASKTTNLLMFDFIDERLIILGDDRNLLYPDGAHFLPEDVFKVYSKEKVLELMETGGESDNFVEIRTDNVTITNGDYTLEFGTFCPPWCGSV